MKNHIPLLMITGVSAPALVLAANPSSPPNTLAGLVDVLLGLVNLAIPLLIGLAFLVIIWKLVDAWVIHVGDETKRAEGKVTAITGVIVVVIMVAIWGIVGILRISLFG